jgi:hypothetical protein
MNVKIGAWGLLTDLYRVLGQNDLSFAADAGSTVTLAGSGVNAGIAPFSASSLH